MMEFRNILLIKPSSLGDIVHALPTAAVLRRRFPTASLTWLVKRQWAEVLEGNPHVSRILPVELSLMGWAAAIREVRSLRCDLIVDLQGLLRSAVLGWLSGAPVRLGFDNAREGSPWFYTHRISAPRTLHAADRYLLVARFLDPAAGAPAIGDFPLPADGEAAARVQHLLFLHGVIPGAALVALNPAARWRTKQWPVASFAELADGLQKEGLRVLIVGDVSDRQLAEDLTRRMRTVPINLVGQTSIKELLALLRQVRLFVTNDSGPMHLAAALGVPILALFGPTDPARTGPYGSRHLVLTSDVPCSPCFSRRCANPHMLECLTSIDPSMALRHALEILQHAQSNAISDKERISYAD